MLAYYVLDINEQDPFLKINSICWDMANSWPNVCLCNT